MPIQESEFTSQPGQRTKLLFPAGRLQPHKNVCGALQWRLSDSSSLISILKSSGAPNAAGVGLANAHLNVRDIEAHKRFRVALGAAPDQTEDDRGHEVPQRLCISRASGANRRKRGFGGGSHLGSWRQMTCTVNNVNNSQKPM